MGPTSEHRRNLLLVSQPADRRSATSSIEGELVTETLEYDGGRKVTAYLPTDPPEAVVFAGDGQLVAKWGGAIEAADVRSTMIVGAHRLDDEMLRLHEYSPGSIQCGSPHTRSSLSKTSAAGRRRTLGQGRPPSARQCSVSQQVESSRSP
jgi:hypothetical protein